MPVTSPDSIYYADGSTPMSAEDISAAEATSVQAAFTNKITNKRQIQTFVWANTAARTAQTGMIAGDFGYQTDTGVTYRYSGTVWLASYSSGLVPIVPTSVAGTGVSYSTTTGLVTFTASSTINLNGVFTSIFSNYKCFLEITNQTIAMIPIARMRLSGTDNSTAVYDHAITYHSAGAFAISAANGSASALLGATNGIAGQGYNVTMDILNPAKAVNTQFNIDKSNPTVGSTAGILNATGAVKHRVTTAFDGITFFSTPASSLTGTVKIYGYN